MTNLQVPINGVKTPPMSPEYGCQISVTSYNPPTKPTINPPPTKTWGRSIEKEECLQNVLVEMENSLSFKARSKSKYQDDTTYDMGSITDYQDLVKPRIKPAVNDRDSSRTNFRILKKEPSLFSQRLYFLF